MMDCSLRRRSRNSSSTPIGWCSRPVTLPPPVAISSGADALSGLARAFFYAGARALLVSHWAVNSEATVRLVTKAFDELKADAEIGRAEAMRRSMLALIESGGGYAHPANWGPFVVVGEGAR